MSALPILLISHCFSSVMMQAQLGTAGVLSCHVMFNSMLCRILRRAPHLTTSKHVISDIPTHTIPYRVPVVTHTLY